VGTRLDPEEALAGPLYLVAALLVVVPLVDYVLSVPPAELDSVQWRFSALGLLSGHVLMPILGLAVAFVTSAVLKHHTLQRWMVFACLTIAMLLLVLSVVFLNDVMQLRTPVPNDGRAAFTSAWQRAVIKLVLSAWGFGYLGWRARKMIPAASRHRGPRPVHVISK
jgi:uncharacterized membrane protein YjfL (UPF0719 family)